jgi:guanine deaminase
MSQESRQSMMQAAIRLSIDSVADGGGPFGAVVVRDGVILGAGRNRVTLDNDPTAHAEVVAIRSACRQVSSFSLTGCELYSSCEPCPMCLGAILWSRLDRVCYAGTRSDAAAAGFDDEAIYEQLSRPIDGRRIPMLQMLREDALAAFAAWKQHEAKTPY